MLAFNRLSEAACTSHPSLQPHRKRYTTPGEDTSPPCKVCSYRSPLRLPATPLQERGGRQIEQIRAACHRLLLHLRPAQEYAGEMGLSSKQKRTTIVHSMLWKRSRWQGRCTWPPKYMCYVGGSPTVELGNTCMYASVLPGPARRVFRGYSVMPSSRATRRRAARAAAEPRLSCCSMRDRCTLPLRCSYVFRNLLGTTPAICRPTACSQLNTGTGNLKINENTLDRGKRSAPSLKPCLCGSVGARSTVP